MFSGVQTERPFQFIFKLFIFALIINFSYTICFGIINFTNLISSSIQELGKDVVHSSISFSELINKLNNKISISASDNPPPLSVVATERTAHGSTPPPT